MRGIVYHIFWLKCAYFVNKLFLSFW
jgi:hypothetical protein